MSGAQRRVALLLGLGFLVVLTVIMIANATSMVSDFQAARVPVSTAHVWLFEVSSIIAWLTTLPALWWLVAWLQRRRLAWWMAALIVIAATLPASAWHIALMWAIRVAVYAAQGEHYRFMGGMADPWLYEYRKDVATVLQFLGLALVAQWLIARAGAATPPAAARTLAVSDGAITHHVPIDEIERVTAAGNYVEIGWVQRTLLQRATLGATASELGNAFVRVHRGLLVRRAAIRRIEIDRSGDFTLTLESGATARGSRRYRAGLDASQRL